MKAEGVENKGGSLAATSQHAPYCRPRLAQRNPNQHIITLGAELEIITISPNRAGRDEAYTEMAYLLNQSFLIDMPFNAYQGYKASSYSAEWHPGEAADLLSLKYDQNKGDWYNKRRFCVKFEQINGMPENGIGVEIVTPIMRLGSFEYLVRGMLETVSFSPLDVIMNTDCGLHVHVGRRGKFNADHLRRIAKAIVIFEEEMDKFHPPWRQYSNTYTKSNREMGYGFRTIIADVNDPLKNFQLIEFLDDLTTLEKVITAINGPQRTNKDFKYNFQSIFNYGTVEFRQARATLNVPWVLAWIKIVVAFVYAAIETDDKVFDQMAEVLHSIYNIKPHEVPRIRKEMFKVFLGLEDPQVFNAALWTGDEGELVQCGRGGIYY